MRKTDKKRENAIISALSQVCDSCLDQAKPQGFAWLTHHIDHKQVQSLIVSCVFDTRQQAELAKADNSKEGLAQKIKQALAQDGIDLRSPVQFDSEQACLEEHNGNWQQRFKRH